MSDLALRLRPLALTFQGAGYGLYLVGGIVRDSLLGSFAESDVDLATDARPTETLRLVQSEATAIWRQGERFGTIGAQWDGLALEITTFRSEVYEDSHRKPTVVFGDNIEDDLFRRDFTVNAIAFELVADEFVDPCGGSGDLERLILRTPLDPSASFSDDPLRLLRAARFIARFGLVPEPALETAAQELAPRMAIVSSERIRDEFEKLLELPTPRSGLEFLDRNHLAGAIVAGEGWSSAAFRSADAAVSKLVRRAAVFYGLEDPDSALRALRYSNAERHHTNAITAAARMILAQVPTAASVRWLHHDLASLAPAGVPDSIQLAQIVEPSSTHPEAVAMISAELRTREDLDDLGPGVSGGDLVDELGLAPGPTIGQLLQALTAHRLDHGPSSRQESLALAAELAPRLLED